MHASHRGDKLHSPPSSLVINLMGTNEGLHPIIIPRDDEGDAFSFLKEGFNLNFPLCRFLSGLSSDVLLLCKRELLFIFSYLWQCFIDITNTNKTFLLKMKSFELNTRKWWEYSGQKLWAMNLRRPNFVPQDDECHCYAGNQAIKQPS